MIEIRDISGKVLLSVVETTDCKIYEELMSLCYISLSWDDENNIQLPAGSYIEYEGEKYRLLEPYNPSFKDENTFQYTPKFYDRVAVWSKKPLFLVTDTGEETDWSMTAYPGQFMEAVVRALLKYTGDEFTYSIDASIVQSTMEYISFQNKNIFDGLTEIANKWNVEWWVEGNIIHLSKCQYGEPITLEVGKNVGVPTETSNKDGYFTRFYAFGSTKNITQEYDDGGFTNGLVNKRLTLSPSLYPGGYMDIRPDLHTEEIFVKTLIFDNIFPSSKLVISAVRAELKDYIDSDGNKIQVGESEGEPLYKQYAIWYFKIDGFSFNNSTYDKDDNPEGMRLSGLDLSVIFESGQLDGREFKLTYHDENQEYEINFIEESGSIIVPGTVSLIPADGDKIVLYNIRMPEEYVISAQEELAEALCSEMERYKRNMNSYTFPSYPVSFCEEGLDIKVGQSVSFIYGGNSLLSRVLKVEKQLDYPIEQTITVGEEKIKGNTQEIKEEIIDANQNIDVVKALADLNKAITDGYGRVQQLIMQSLSQYKGLWTLEYNGYPNDPSKWSVKTGYTAISEKDIVCYGVDEDVEDVPFPIATANVLGLVKVGEGLSITADGTLSVSGGSGGLDIQKLEEYLTSNKYYNYLSKLTGYVMAEQYTAITVEDTILSAFGKLEKNFSNYVDLFTDQTIDGVKTFKKTIFGQQDIVCYAVDDTVEDVEFPIASANVLGLVKIGEGLNITADGTLSAAGGGGVNFTPGTGLNLTSANVLEVVFGTTSTTVCRGNDSRLSDARRNPYSLSWSGYSSGSYDGSSAASISIPSNTNQLTNGAGFIYDGNRNFTSLSGSGSASQYLAGNGRFYTVGFNELGSVPSWITNWDTDRFNLNSNGGAVFKSAGSMVSPSHSDSPIASLGVEIFNNQVRGLNNSSVGNLYLNYINSSNYVKVDADCNIQATGDIVCYAVGDAADVEFSVSWSDITGKPSWIGSSKPSYSWSEISGKPSWIGNSKPSYTASEVGAISSITYSESGSGNVVTSVSANGRTVTVRYGSVSGGGWDGGDVYDDINIRYPGQRLRFYLSNGDTRVLLGNTDGIQYWVTGSLKAVMTTSGAWSQQSDIRLKNITGSVYGILDKLNNINVYKYQYINNPGEDHIGVIAQDVIKVFPELVVETLYMENSNEKRYSVDYATLGAVVAIQGIKELYNLLKNIDLWRSIKDQQISQLQQDNLKLKARIEALEKGGNA